MEGLTKSCRYSTHTLDPVIFSDLMSSADQITVYNSSSLFPDNQCKGSGGCGLVTPVVVVTTSNNEAGGVNVTYEGVKVSVGTEAECAVWNTSRNG